MRLCDIVQVGFNSLNQDNIVIDIDLVIFILGVVPAPAFTGTEISPAISNSACIVHTALIILAYSTRWGVGIKSLFSWIYWSLIRLVQSTEALHPWLLLRAAHLLHLLLHSHTHPLLIETHILIHTLALIWHGFIIIAKIVLHEAGNLVLLVVIFILLWSPSEHSLTRAGIALLGVRIHGIEVALPVA